MPPILKKRAINHENSYESPYGENNDNDVKAWSSISSLAGRSRLNRSTLRVSQPSDTVIKAIAKQRDVN